MIRGDARIGRRREESIPARGPTGAGPQPGGPAAGAWLHVRGFTLMEILVVLAITGILMFLILVPLSRSLDLSQRSAAEIEAQENVRRAMRRIAREVGQAMEIYEPRPLAVWGYSAWTVNRNRPSPATGAVPRRNVVPNGVFSFRLPKHLYYDEWNRHAVTPADIGALVGPNTAYDYVALDSCPRHPGAPLELRPLTPLEPDRRIVAYFVGLKDPSLRDPGTGNPVYENILLFRRSFFPNNNRLNTYALYRVEFDPTLPQFRNWNLPNGAPNPDFFYDATPVTAPTPGGSVTKPQWQWWLESAVSVMNVETGDVVRWLEAGSGSMDFMPGPLVTLTPAPVQDEDLQPNRDVWQAFASGQTLPTDLAPREYRAEHGHWMGVPNEQFGVAGSPFAGLPNDGSWVIWDGIAIGNPTAGAGVAPGPRIQVFERGPTATTLVFDSQTNVRNRLVAFDPVVGRVITAVPRRDYGAATQLEQEHYDAPIDPTTLSVDLTADVETDPRGMPSSFGAALGSPRFAATTMIVPGSESVILVDMSVSPPERHPLKRVGWSIRRGSSLNRDAVPSRPDEYTIDYRTGRIFLYGLAAGQDPTVWTGVGPGGPRRLMVKYEFQTNAPRLTYDPVAEMDVPTTIDVVRVSYVTKEMVQANLGVVQYTRRRQEVLPFEVSERVVVRNLKR